MEIEKNITTGKIIKKVANNLQGVVLQHSLDETSLFYNSSKKLSNGMYFCIIKE